MVGLCRLRLLVGDFWAKLDTSANDAIAFDGRGIRGYLKVISGVGLSNMGSVRATQLAANLSLEEKVVISV